MSTSGAFAQQEHLNYSLFHPIPKEHMREMETDRLDVTESPCTIDAEHMMSCLNSKHSSKKKYRPSHIVYNKIGD